MSRRLPIYLLLDVSGSMQGEPIESVKNGLSILLEELRGEPQALETAYLSVITFESVAKQVVPLTDLFSFQEPQLNAGGSTALGDALSLTAQKISTEVIKNSADTKGDWKPMVVIFTDGEPTDDWQKGANDIKAQKAFVIACAAGPNANDQILKQITESVIHLKSCSSGDIIKFFKWISSSIKTSSTKIDSGQGTANGLSELPALPPELQIAP